MNDACERYLELLSGSLDGEISAEEQRELDAHLAECVDCRRLLEELRGDEEAVRDGHGQEGEESERERAALARTIQAIRDEPEPEWAASRGRKRWRWGLTLRWSAGVAVAAAAVLLAMRLGPSPTEPIRARSIPTVQEAPAPGTQTETQTLAQTQTQTHGSGVSGAPTELPAAAAPIAPPPQAPRAASQESEQKASPPSPNRETDLVESSPTDAQESPATDSSTLPQHVETPPVSKDELVTRDAPAPRGMAARGETPEGNALYGSSAVRVKSAQAGGTATESARTLDVEMVDSSAPWYMSVTSEDTTDAEGGWNSRLSAAEVELAASPGKLPSDERARRYRALGDLWEWLGRRSRDAFASARAVDCYRNAVTIDSGAAAVDSTRAQRARAAVSAAGMKKIQPAYR
jgi:hypothetical protein